MQYYLIYLTDNISNSNDGIHPPPSYWSAVQGCHPQIPEDQPPELCEEPLILRESQVYFRPCALEVGMTLSGWNPLSHTHCKNSLVLSSAQECVCPARTCEPPYSQAACAGHRFVFQLNMVYQSKVQPCSQSQLIPNWNV